LSDHYYTSNPGVDSNPKTWSFELRNHNYKFTSDNGVFSKKEVDFGSRLLIESFHSPEVSGNILDVGCGYGPIGIAIARDFKERTIEMVDVNERAIQLAKVNSELNLVNNVIIYKSDIFSEVKNTTFAAILTNPPIRAGKKVVHQILEESFSKLVNGGELWVVIQKKQGAPSAIKKLEEVYTEVDVLLKKKGYYIIKAKKG
jgi:16S rRNA (guanine1207-N2)-methyltransferase